MTLIESGMEMVLRLIHKQKTDFTMYCPNGRMCCEYHCAYKGYNANEEQNDKYYTKPYCLPL